ncbi:zinc metalloproteinase nas-14 [Hyalella azteca]|uniref:Zinc metalloproteinase nas-14 n=1 Tax=Hyalella azteca TaxID=294128 RepID=A0A8B7P273_HYAAZ|nr:zinc metalloproteinase nas-14 [Hyalella azteca]
MPESSIGNYYELSNYAVEKAGFLRVLMDIVGIMSEHNSYQRDKYITLTPSMGSIMEYFTKDEKNYFNLIFEEYDYESATHISEDLAWSMAMVRITSKDPKRPVPKTIPRRLSKLDMLKIADLHGCNERTTTTKKPTTTTKKPTTTTKKPTTTTKKPTTTTSTTTTKKPTTTTEKPTSTTSTTTTKKPTTTSTTTTEKPTTTTSSTSTTTRFDFNFIIDGIDGGDFGVGFSDATTTSTVKPTTTENDPRLLWNWNVQNSSLAVQFLPMKLIINVWILPYFLYLQIDL